MPELPDLVYLENRLNEYLPGQKITAAEVQEPIVLRLLLPGDFAESLRGAQFQTVKRHGPFLTFSLSGDKDLVVHPMLAGRFHWNDLAAKSPAACALSLRCEASGHTLHYSDDKKMGKVYLARRGERKKIPRFNEQGPDLLSPDFTLEYFKAQLKKSRKQVRVLLMDQSVVSCIGNAYADEILFAAGIHPKTFCYQLAEAEIEKLHHAILKVVQWGIAEVERAAKPIEVKVRDHVKVRNRKDEPCPRCGAKIRRAGVLGYDAFFCPACQPLQRSQFIDWRNLKNE
jgi:formamidopyrimidine-DNA glycosylase